MTASVWHLAPPGPTEITVPAPSSTVLFDVPPLSVRVVLEPPTATVLVFQVPPFLPRLPRLHGAGRLSGTATAGDDFNLVASAHGHGALTATVESLSVAPQLAGHGVLSAAARLFSIQEGAALAGRGALAATVHAEIPGAGAATGHGSLTATTRARIPVTAAATGQGSLAGSAVARLATQAALVGHGAATAAAAATRFILAGHPSGTGALSGVAHAKSPAAGAVSGRGALTAATKAVRFATAALAGHGGLSATSRQVFTVHAAVSGLGVLTGATQTRFAAPAVLAGRGALVGAAYAKVPVSASLSGAGQLSVSAVAFAIDRAASLSGTGVLTATAIPQFASSAALTGTGVLTATATLPGAVTLDSTGGGGSTVAADTLSWTQIIGPDVTILLVATAAEQQSASVTCGTTTMSNPFGAGFAGCALYVLVNPPTGEQTITVTSPEPDFQTGVSAAFTNCTATVPAGPGYSGLYFTFQPESGPSEMVSPEVPCTVGNLAVMAMFGSEQSGGSGFFAITDPSGTVAAYQSLNTGPSLPVMIQYATGPDPITFTANYSGDAWAVCGLELVGVQQATAGLPGAGVLNGTAKAAAPAALPGSGLLSATATALFSAPAPTSGAGVLSATDVEQFQRSAALTGQGVLSAAIIPKLTAAVAGRGALTAAVKPKLTATVAGRGALAGIAHPFVHPSLTGIGALSGTAHATKFVLAGAATGHGALTATAGRLGKFTGTGVLSAIAAPVATAPVVVAALDGAGTGGFGTFNLSTFTPYNIGDLIIMFVTSYGSNTDPTNDGSGVSWTTIDANSGANSVATKSVYWVATALNGMTGNWTASPNDISIDVIVVRGQSTSHPIGGHMENGSTASSDAASTIHALDGTVGTALVNNDGSSLLLYCYALANTSKTITWSAPATGYSLITGPPTSPYTATPGNPASNWFSNVSATNFRNSSTTAPAASQSYSVSGASNFAYRGAIIEVRSH